MTGRARSQKKEVKRIKKGTVTLNGLINLFIYLFKRSHKFIYLFLSATFKDFFQEGMIVLKRTFFRHVLPVFTGKVGRVPLLCCLQIQALGL